MAEPSKISGLPEAVAIDGNTEFPINKAGVTNKVKLSTVLTYLNSNVTPVASVNGRTGAITIISADVTGALGYTPVSAGGGTISSTNALNFNSSSYNIAYTGQSGATHSANNFSIASFWGVGLTNTIGSPQQTIPPGFYSHSFNTRTGAASIYGNVVAGGTLYANTARIYTSGSSVVLNAGGRVATLTSSTPAAGGTGVVLNERFRDASGNLYTATAVSGGAATTITLNGAMPIFTTAPSNPVALTSVGGSGAGVTVNLTWSQSADLSLNPSGNTTAENNLTVNGTLSALTGLTVTGNGTVSGTLGVTGIATFSNSVIVANGQTTPITISSGTISVGTSKSIDMRVSTAGQTIAFGAPGAGLGYGAIVTANSDGNSAFGAAPNDLAASNRLSFNTIRSFGNTYALSGTVTPTSFSGTGTTATITYTAISGVIIPIGSTITITGATPSGYNVTNAVVTSSTITSVTVACTATGTLSVAGTLSYKMAVPKVLNINSNWSGMPADNSGFVPYLISVASDTTDTRYTGNGGTVLQVAHNFGGAARGGKSVFRATLTQTSSINDPITSGIPNQQHTIGEFWGWGNYNAGGTGSNSSAAGSLYGLNPQTILSSGATYWRLLNGLGEVNLAAYSSTRTVTLSGTVTSGDIVSIIFTSSDIVGSPVTISWTVGAGQTLGMIANNLCAMIIANTALADARISASVSGSVISIYYYTHIATLTVTTSKSISATEVLSVSAEVPGSSVDIKLMGSMIRLAADSAPATLNSAFLLFGSQQGSGTAGLFNYGLCFGALVGYNGEWSWQKKSTLIGAGLSVSYGGSNQSAPLIPNFAAYGVDWRNVNFTYGSGAAFASARFTVFGDGSITLGQTKFLISSSGFAIDIPGKVATSVAVSAGGGGGAGGVFGNYFVGDLIFDDYGGQYRVLTVNSSTGGVATLSMLVAPAYTGSAPTNPISTRGGSGTGLTLNVTWPAAGTTLALQGSGGATTIGGILTVSGVVDVPSLMMNGVPFASAPAAVSNGYQTIIGRDAGLGLSTAAIESTIIGWRAGGSDGAGMSGAENTLVGWHSGNVMTTGGFNTALGVNTMGFETTGNNNVAVGTDSMRNSVGLIANVAVGVNSLRNGAGTIASVAVGHEALKGDETVPSASVGSDLVAIGYQAMISASRTTAGSMIAIGTRAVSSITTASGGVLIGHEAGKVLTTALHAVGIGHQALLKLTTGAANVAVGRNTLNEITTQANNTAVGHLAGQTITGAGNVVIGTQAGSLATTVNNMVAIGITAAKNATGNNNIVIGASAGSTTLTSGSNNILIGNSSADVTTGSDSGILKIAFSAVPVISATGITGTTPVVTIPALNVTNNLTVSGIADVSSLKMNGLVFASSPGGYSYGINIVGSGAGIGISNSAIESTIFGHRAGGSEGAGMTGYENTLIGWCAGAQMTSGYFNTAVGTGGMWHETTGAFNVSVGADAMRNTVGVNYCIGVGMNAVRNGNSTTASIGIGQDALRGQENTSTVGSNNIAIGFAVMKGEFTLTTAANNVFVGNNAAQNAITTAASNVGVGHSVLNALSSGIDNVALGVLSLSLVTTGGGNVSLGAYSGDTLTTGANNILIGKNAGSTTLQTGSNNILIGNVNADTATGSTSGVLVIAMSTVPVLSATGINGTTPVATIPTLVVTNSVTAATLIPSGSTAPTNGMYLPAANTVGFAASSTQALTITSTVVAVKPTTAATSPSTGALTVAGGVGIAGAVFTGGAVQVGTSGNIVTITHNATSGTAATIAFAGTGGVLLSTNSANVLRLTNPASAVNYWSITGSIVNGLLTIGADSSSSDSNVSLAISPKGTGGVVIGAVDVPGEMLVVNGNIISAGMSWRSRPITTASTWEAITFGNDRFVAVASADGGAGAGERVMWSLDGVNWNLATAASTNQWTKVVWGKVSNAGLFVAVSITGSANRAMTSPDGITWTARTTTGLDSTWRGLCYGANLFVAVASSGTNLVMTSPDGVTWTARTPSVSNQWFGVTWGNGLYVAVAASGTGDRIMTSPDGTTWTTRTSPEDNAWRAVRYANGLFVAVASSGTNRCMTSPDGITWTARAMPAGNWYSITYGDGLWVAISNGSTFRIATSVDGINWVGRTSPEANSFQAIAYGNGMFAAASTDGTNRVIISGKQISSHYN